MLKQAKLFLDKFTASYDTSNQNLQEIAWFCHHVSLTVLLILLPNSSNLLHHKKLYENEHRWHNA